MTWQAGITEPNGRAFKIVFKKMLDSTQPKDKREYEECIDATVSARNVLLRTHGVSPYQHVFGRDPELAFDVQVPRADSAAVTMPVLDCPVNTSPIRQAARQAFVESQDDRAMRRALGGENTSLEGIPGWRSSCVLAKGQGSWHATWPCSLAWASSSAGTVVWINELVGCVQTSVTQGVTGTVANGHNPRKGRG